MIRPLLLACALGLAAVPVIAQDAVVIYRCTDANGAVSVQNDVPCPKGSQQQRRVMETPAPAAIPPMPAASPVTGPATAPAGAIDGNVVDGGDSDPDAAGENADNLPTEPPPALFSCRTWDRQEYFSDDPIPTRRCAPLRVSGLDGSAGGGLAAACEYVTDTCAPVPETALCKQWQQHAHDIRAKLLFGRAEDPAATRVELDRIEGLIHASTCRDAN
ncbi:DUF4124 domain-containing protein [Novilysobacter antarcticus]|uniref:DUF4124 domain-containing protein n=1 Tax=Novilysobacter antarcticus TaxID=2862543 RepID=UPI001C9A12C2